MAFVRLPRDKVLRGILLLSSLARDYMQPMVLCYANVGHIHPDFLKMLLLVKVFYGVVSLVWVHDSWYLLEVHDPIITCTNHMNEVLQQRTTFFEIGFCEHAHDGYLSRASSLFLQLKVCARFFFLSVSTRLYSAHGGIELFKARLAYAWALKRSW